ncbi:MAG: hypothetical protein HOO96_24340 [Polyangiaceae bacterium]|nr:hypothetical protein [Polyangiaceae bacterium]
MKDELFVGGAHGRTGCASWACRVRRLSLAGPSLYNAAAVVHRGAVILRSAESSVFVVRQ